MGIAKPITVSGISISGADAGNYTFNTAAATTANITPKALTVSGITASNKTYDGTTAATVMTSGATLTGLVAGDALTVAATGVFADKNAAAGKTVNLINSYAGADVANYTITGQTLATANISPAALSVNANAASKTEGKTDPALTFSVTGLVANETEASTLSGALVRNTGETAGLYLIKQGTLKANANYAINYTPADLTITAAPVQNAEPSLIDTLNKVVSAMPKQSINVPTAPPTVTSASLSKPSAIPVSDKTGSEIKTDSKPVATDAASNKATTKNEDPKAGEGKTADSKEVVKEDNKEVKDSKDKKDEKKAVASAEEPTSKAAETPASKPLPVCQ